MVYRQAGQTRQSDSKKETQSNTVSSSPTYTSKHPFLQFRQSIGNQALGQFIQAKLKGGKPRDIYEQEAGRVAEQVMRMSEHEIINKTKDPSKTLGPRIQRLCPECKDELGRQSEEEFIQLKGLHAVAKINNQQNEPEPLSHSTRMYFEPRFGQDFNHVRVHTGTLASEAAQSIKARAFTLGSSIVFGQGEYQPESEQGRRLLAHELTHVVQQNGAQSFDRYGSIQVSTQALPHCIMRVPTARGIREDPPRYIYSENCGWIDWSHAQPGLMNTLIDRVQEASRQLETAQATGGQILSGAVGPGRVIGPRMESRAGILLSGVTPVAYLKRPLNTTEEVLSVALSIFQLQSTRFEALQSWTNWIGESSFSEEDLPSNIIGFYRAARSFDRPRIEQLCQIWSVEDSLREFEGYSFQQNRTFQPLRLPIGGQWPSELSDIHPAQSGGPLFELAETVSETTFSEPRRECYRDGQVVPCGETLDVQLMRSGTLSLAQVGSTSAVDLTDQRPGQGPDFQVMGLPAQHNLRFRWIIADSQDRRYLMWGRQGRQVFQYSTQSRAYVPSRTRALLIERNIREAEILCRVQSGNEDMLLRHPVRFSF